MYLSTRNSIFQNVKAVLLAMLVVSLWGCSEKIEPQPLTYSQLLTGKESKTWMLTTVEIVDNGSSQPVGVNQLFDRCIADDLYVFYANEEKKFEAQEGASKCNANDPNVYVEGTWALTNATATLEFPLPILTGSTAIPFTIKQLTETSLTVEYYFLDINASYRFIFTAQKAG